MPGGPREAFNMVAPILRKCAAQVDDGPCTAYIGPIGSGNYVKMVIIFKLCVFFFVLISHEIVMA
jgi:6-phosphogluconate dehydrogenase